MKSRFADDVDFVRGLEMAAGGREIDVLELVKPEEGGLGFSVVGLKSESKVELGIFVQGIQPGGVADRYLFYMFFFLCISYMKFSIAIATIAFI